MMWSGVRRLARSGRPGVVRRAAKSSGALRVASSGSEAVAEPRVLVLGDDDLLAGREALPRQARQRVALAGAPRREAAQAEGDEEASFLEDAEIRERSGRIPLVDVRADLRRKAAASKGASAAASDEARSRAAGIRRGEHSPSKGAPRREVAPAAYLSEEEIARRSSRNERVDRAAERRQRKPVARLRRATMTVGQLASALSVEARAVSEVLDGRRAHETVDPEAAELVALELGKSVRFAAAPKTKKTTTKDEELEELARLDRLEAAVREAVEAATPAAAVEALPLRRPIVAVMGHVDHGKTTLLDALRGASTAAAEAGGITQRLAAFEVGDVTFIDTPGHAAFSTMRSSSARALDVALVVVALDDGVKPQTLEALRLAERAKSAVVFAATKADKFGSSSREDALERVAAQLAERGFATERHGGDHPLVPVAAPRGEGLAELTEALAMHAELLDLRADPDAPARAVVADAVADKRLGLCLDVLVVWGTLRKGDVVVVGESVGKVRRLVGGDAGPSSSTRVVAGFDKTARVAAGDAVLVAPDERSAKKIARARAALREATEAAERRRLMAGDDALGGGEQQQALAVPVVVKVESNGELDAVRDLVRALPSSKARVEVVGGVAVGAVGRADVDLAATLGAPVFAFNVGLAAPDVKDHARRNAVDLRSHDVVYALLDDIAAHAVSALPPVPTPRVQAKLNVLKLITLSDGTVVAGCKVVDGTLRKSDPIRHVRDGVLLAVDDRGPATLKHFKDDVTTLPKGAECGLALHDRDIAAALLEGDVLEAFTIVDLPPTLDDDHHHSRPA